MAFILPHILLAKALMRRAATNSIAFVTAAAAVQDQRSKYILSVLQSTRSHRDDVFTQAAALAETHPFRAQLYSLLYMFETLSDEKKQAFVEAFKTTSTLASQGSMEVVEQNTNQPGHQPPHNVP